MQSLNDLTRTFYSASVDAETSQATATVTAPTANTDIVSFAVLKGLYEITAIAWLATGGTPAAGDQNNMKLYKFAGGVNLLTLPLRAVTNAEPIPVTVRHRFTADTTLAIRSVGAGTASVPYVGTLIAKRLGD